MPVLTDGLAHGLALASAGWPVLALGILGVAGLVVELMEPARHEDGLTAPPDRSATPPG
jgi:hypothetical protein